MEESNVKQESNTQKKKRLAREFNEKVMPPSKRISDLTYEEKELMKLLSKEVFGSSSRWKRLVENGHTELLTEKVTEYVPGEKEEDEGTTREVEVPVKFANGAHQYVMKRYTIEEILAYMLDRKKQIDLIKIEIKKRQDEERAKKAKEELAKSVHEDLHGSAV